jgi:hypothetical protein
VSYLKISDFNAIYILYSIQISFFENGYKEIPNRASCKVWVVLNQNEYKISPLLSIVPPEPKLAKELINFEDNIL